MDILNLIASLFALIVLEVILGIDNLIFLSILTDKLPVIQRRKARHWGLMFAWMTRLLLLSSALWLIKMTTPLFQMGDFSFSARDLFLIVGGMFLITKATQEIHEEFRENEIQKQPASVAIHYRYFWKVVTQVGLMDIIFSLDSVLTAVGLTSYFWVMAVAITIAIFIMIYASESVSYFIRTHPSIKMLALSFLIVIGMVLVADGLQFHIPRGYIYFAMAYALGVEGLNLIRRSRLKNRK